VAFKSLVVHDERPQVSIAGLPPETSDQFTVFLDVADQEAFANLSTRNPQLLFVGSALNVGSLCFFGLLLCEADNEQSLFTMERLATKTYTNEALVPKLQTKDRIYQRVGLVIWSGSEDGYLKEMEKEQAVVTII